MKPFLRQFAGLLLLALATAGVAEEIVFRQVALTLSQEGFILLDAEIDYDLTETVSEALENGVPLTFETHVQMRRAEAWLWESDTIEHRLRTVLRHRPLSGLYELRSLEGSEPVSFATRDSALRALGRIIAMPIIARSELDLDDEYVVRLRVRLDIEALPLPMRPIAYLRRDWSLASEPWEWRLKP
jgi:hypothetical protein